jgi:hypothetical protein
MPRAASAFPLLASLIVVAAVAGGCARVPPESVRLNHAVGGRINDLRQRHLNLARVYLDFKRQQFYDWIMAEYEPAFRQNYADAWAARRGGAFDPADEVARRQYTRDVIAEYEGLASQVRESEQQFLSRLEGGYADATQANAAVGALLQSAADLHAADRGAWDGSVGRVLPAAQSDLLDRALAALQAAAIKSLGAGPHPVTRRSSP